MLNAPPLRYMSAILLNVQEKMSAFTPPPVTTIRNETFFGVDVGWRCWQAAKGWLCLTDAQRYYTTLQFWQVAGSADGVYPGLLARFSPYLVSYAGCGRDTRDPRGGYAIIWDAPRQMGCIQDFWRASRPILSATPGAGETPAIPGGYAIVWDAPWASGAFQDGARRHHSPALWAKVSAAKERYSPAISACSASPSWTTTRTAKSSRSS